MQPTFPQEVEVKGSMHDPQVLARDHFVTELTYLQFLGQLQTRAARTARQCFATTATTALQGTGFNLLPVHLFHRPFAQVCPPG